MKKVLGFYLLGFFCGVLALRIYDNHFMKLYKTVSFETDPLLLRPSSCESGDRVIVRKSTSFTSHPPANSWEHFKINEKFINPKFTWSLPNFSSLHNLDYTSNEFSAGGRNWHLLVYPNGINIGWDKSISVYIVLSEDEKLKPYEKVYARVYLRILNQLNSNHVEVLIENWFEGPGGGHGEDEFLPLEDLKDPSNGFLVDDTLKFQVEFLQVSSIY